jgi:hypothetical protein
MPSEKSTSAALSARNQPPDDLDPGVLAWLPRRSVRQFSAGPGGLRYLTVHRRRAALVLDPAMRPASWHL